MIKENSNGTFTAVVYINATQRRKKTLSTRRLAEDWVALMRLKREREELHGKDNKVPLEEVIKAYRRGVKKSDNSISRDFFILKRWDDWFSRHKIKYVSEIDLSVIRKYEQSRLQTPKAGNKDETISQSTANKDIKLLNAILNHAWKYQEIAYNPIAKYPYSKEEKIPRRNLMIDEILMFLEEAKKQNVFKVFYGILTMGLRNEEACFLQGSDLKHKSTVHIHPKEVWDFDDNNRRAYFDWSPKWNKERWIDLGKNYLDDKYLIDLMANTNGPDYCFPKPGMYGRPFDRNSLYKKFKCVLKATKIKKQEELNVHTLRHVHISYQVARIGLDKRITFPSLMDNVGISDLKTLMGYTKAVKGLAGTWNDPTKLPWQI